MKSNTTRPPRKPSPADFTAAQILDACRRAIYAPAKPEAGYYTAKQWGNQWGMLEKSALRICRKAAKARLMHAKQFKATPRHYVWHFKFLRERKPPKTGSLLTPRP